VIGGQVIGHRTPRPARLGEAVDEDESGAATVDLDMEHGTIVTPR
jgi:hypothetical protein